MPVEVVRSALPQLVERLRQYLPEVIRVQSNIRSLIGGHCDGQTVWVDDWPEVKAVVCVVDTGQAEFGYWRNRLEMFCSSPDALESILRHNPAIDWSKEFLVAAVSDVCMQVVSKMASEKKAGVVKPYDTELYIYYLPDDMWPSLSLADHGTFPSTSRIGTMDPSFSTLLSRTWEPEGGPSCDRYIRALIDNMPSVALYGGDGRPLAYCLLYYYWALALLFVQPESRGKGLGKLITIEMLKKIKQQAPDQMPYLVAAKKNTTAIAMYEQLNFRRVDRTLYWFLFEPATLENLCAHPRDRTVT